MGEHENSFLSRPHALRNRPLLRLTPLGRGFAVLLAGLLIGSVNYSNNLSFLMTFLLAGMVLASLFTARAMAREASVDPLEADPVFAGNMAAFRVRVSGGGGRIYLGLDMGPEQAVDIGPDGKGEATLLCLAAQRGRLLPGHVRVRSDYPFGLVQALWWRPFSGSCLVYPKPLPGHPMPGKAGEDSDRDAMGEAAKGTGVDDFDELRDYRPGDSPRLVDWRASSRSRNLVVKQFSGAYGGRLHFSLDQLADMGVETALSILCDWVVRAGEQDLVFGLSMPEAEVPPGSGKAHGHTCLKLLALHGHKGGTHG